VVYRCKVMSTSSLLTVFGRTGVVLSLGLASCSAPGPYGYAQVYSPLDSEEEATKGSVPFDPSAATRKPDVWRGRLVSTFGIVTEVTPGASPDTRKVLLSMRGLQPRNLCDGPDDETCRVTVTDTEFARLWAVLPNAALVPKTTPPDPVQPGSLLRVVGKLEVSNVVSEPPTIHVTLARHWPLQTYVTTRARESMRR
jgi:hypothetical protein